MGSPPAVMHDVRLEGKVITRVDAAAGTAAAAASAIERSLGTKDSPIFHAARFQMDAEVSFIGARVPGLVIAVKTNMPRHRSDCYVE